MDILNFPDHREFVMWWSPITGTPQEDAFDDDTPEANILFAGGYGSGKTTTAMAKALKLSAINAPLPILWTVPDFGHITDTLIPTLIDTDPDTGKPWFLTADQFEYEERKHILTWEGGIIHFASARYAQSIKGPNMAAAVLDEPGIMSKEAWRNTVSRVRHPRAPLRQKFAAGTPEGLNYLVDLFDDDEKKLYRMYRMDTRQNTELLRHMPDYIEQIASVSTEAELESYLRGGFIALHGAPAYHAFDPENNFREDVPGMIPTEPLRISFDFNVDPMACIIAQFHTGPFGRECIVHDAVIKRASWTPEICDEIIARYAGWEGGVIVYGDATGGYRSTVSLQSNYDLIMEKLQPKFPAGVTIHESVVKRYNPPEVDRLNAMNVLFCNALKHRRLFIKKVRPTKTSTTQPLARSLQLTTLAPGTNSISKPSGETHTHASDALGYLVVAEFPVRRPRVFGTENFNR